MDKLLEELDGALLVRSTLFINAICAWFGGQALHLYHPDGNEITVRIMAGPPLDHMLAGDCMIAWAKQLA